MQLTLQWNVAVNVKGAPLHSNGGEFFLFKKDV